MDGDFRKLMAFPMFATVAWLVWVLGQQSSIDGAGALLVLLVAMSMLVWALTLRGVRGPLFQRFRWPRSPCWAGPPGRMSPGSRRSKRQA
jgi:hypothetical protein